MLLFNVCTASLKAPNSEWIGSEVPPAHRYGSSPVCSLYQLSSQPYCCDLISLFMSFLIIFPSLWKGKYDRDFFPFLVLQTEECEPTSDMGGHGIESPFLSLQAVDELFSQEVSLLSWGHFYVGSDNLHRDKDERICV